MLQEKLAYVHSAGMRDWRPTRQTSAPQHGDGDGSQPGVPADPPAHTASPPLNCIAISRSATAWIHGPGLDVTYLYTPVSITMFAKQVELNKCSWYGWTTMSSLQSSGQPYNKSSPSDTTAKRIAGTSWRGFSVTGLSISDSQKKKKKHTKAGLEP